MQQIRVSLSRDAMRAIKHLVLGERPFSDRVSFSLTMHLAYLYESRGDYFAVLDQLDFMEKYLERPGKRRVSSTKPATKFVKPPLDRFWHKHFSSARHLIHNILGAWELSQGGTGSQALDAMMTKVATEHGDDPAVWPGVLAHHFVVDGYTARAGRRDRQREGRLTGDWIVFGKHAGQNYYLALASHGEGDDPERLYRLIVQNCAAEFPFLFE